jgi:hypothetical protein
MREDEVEVFLYKEDGDDIERFCWELDSHIRNSQYVENDCNDANAIDSFFSDDNNRKFGKLPDYFYRKK